MCLNFFSNDVLFFYRVEIYLWWFRIFYLILFIFDMIVLPENNESRFVFIIELLSTAKINSKPNAYFQCSLFHILIQSIVIHCNYGKDAILLRKRKCNHRRRNKYTMQFYRRWSKNEDHFFYPRHLELTPWNSFDKYIFEYPNIWSLTKFITFI